MAGKMMFVIMHGGGTERGGSRVSRGSRAAMREDQYDFPVSTPPAVRRLIDAGGGQSVQQELSFPDKLNLYSTGTKFWSRGPNEQRVELIAPGGRTDERAWPAIAHNLNVLVGRFNPDTNKFEPLMPQKAPAEPAK